MRGDWAMLKQVFKSGGMERSRDVAADASVVVATAVGVHPVVGLVALPREQQRDWTCLKHNLWR